MSEISSKIQNQRSVKIGQKTFNTQNQLVTEFT